MCMNLTPDMLVQPGLSLPVCSPTYSHWGLRSWCCLVSQCLLGGAGLPRQNLRWQHANTMGRLHAVASSSQTGLTPIRDAA